MKQYIDKSAVVAEIERKIEAHKETLKNCDSSISEMVLKGSMSAYQNLLFFLDTLEMKDDMDAIHPIEDVVSNDTLANSLEISRHGNSHNGNNSDLEEAAGNYPSIIRTISPQWESEIERAFIAGTQWQKKQTIEKICKWLEDNIDHYAYNKDFVPNAKERFIKMFRRAEI